MADVQIPFDLPANTIVVGIKLKSYYAVEPQCAADILLWTYNYRKNPNYIIQLKYEKPLIDVELKEKNILDLVVYVCGEDRGEEIFVEPLLQWFLLNKDDKNLSIEFTVKEKYLTRFNNVQIIQRAV
jgi:hypothetical protein